MTLRRRDRGFTLLEIIVSLAIVALGIAAVAKATGGAAATAGETRERMLAVWVAGNRLATLNISRSWPSPGQYDASTVMGGRTWHLAQVVSETEIDSIRRVDIEVFTDPDHEIREYRTFGFVARYQPPEAAPPDEDGIENQEDEDAGLEEEEVPLPGDEPPPGEAGAPQNQEQPPGEPSEGEG